MWPKSGLKAVRAVMNGVGAVLSLLPIDKVLGQIIDPVMDKFTPTLNPIDASSLNLLETELDSLNVIPNQNDFLLNKISEFSNEAAFVTACELHKFEE